MTPAFSTAELSLVNSRTVSADVEVWISSFGLSSSGPSSLFLYLFGVLETVIVSVIAFLVLFIHHRMMFLKYILKTKKLQRNSKKAHP